MFPPKKRTGEQPPAMHALEARRFLSATIDSLTLVDADTGSAIATLRPHSVLNLATLPTTHLNIVAQANSDTQSVKFSFDRNPVHLVTESPFVLVGAATGGNFRAWTPALGDHMLTATAYASSTPTRSAGGSSATFSLQVINTLGRTGRGVGVGAPPATGNWNLQFDDEFDGSSAYNNWNYTIWGLTDSAQWDEAESYSPGAVTESGGTLNLTATPRPRNGYPYTSGLVTTSDSFSFTYGYVEARMKLAPGQGLWPAFWMLPTPDNGNYHDGDGEIDIMEYLGGQPTTDYVHLHHNGTVGAGIRTADLSAGYHTYGLDWEPDHITWYLDGQAIFTVTANVPDVPEYLILNLAVGTASDWPGAPNRSTAFPATMSIDYVRVWQTS